LETRIKRGFPHCRSGEGVAAWQELDIKGPREWPDHQIGTGSLERLTVARYDDVNMDSDVSSISMSINKWLLAQLLSIQQLPTQSRFKIP